jgi:glucose-6-phosphate isomerase
VLTAVGQAPLHAAGLDGHLMVDAAADERDRLAAEGERRAHLARSVAWRAANAAPYSILWCYSELLTHLGAWLQQLECESLGRHRADDSRVGELVCVLRGPADQHSVAQLLLDGPRRGRLSFLDFEDPPGAELAGLPALGRLRAIEREATRASMTLPTRSLSVRDRSPATLAALMVHGMLETVITADRTGVDPYGQPAVERIKVGIRERLAGSERAD